MNSLIWASCFLLILFNMECSQLPSNRPKLLDSSTPAYRGTVNPLPLDMDYFTKRHPFLSGDSRVPNKLDLLSDDTLLEIFGYLRNDNFYHFPKLIFSCKRLYRVFGKLVMTRFSKFNPQLFWSLPPHFRLLFALKFMYDFEEMYSKGIKLNFILNRDEICGMLFVVLHVRNGHYISKMDLKFIESIKTGKNHMKKRMRDRILYSFSPSSSSSSYFRNMPSYGVLVSSPAVWRLIILSHCCQRMNYFAVQAICKLDPSLTEFAIDLVVKFGEFNEKDKSLLRTIVTEATSLKYLLNQSINTKKMSIFKEFLPHWTGSIASLALPDTLDPTDPTNAVVIVDSINNGSHVLIKIATSDLACPELLDYSEISQDHFLLSSILKSCEKVGNHQMATDLITKFPNNQTFSYYYNPELIGLLRDAVNSQRHDGAGLSNATQLELALLLASLHFPQTGILETFKRLIRGKTNPAVMEELSRKKTMMYCESAKSGQSSCIIQ